MTQDVFAEALTNSQTLAKEKKFFETQDNGAMVMENDDEDKSSESKPSEKSSGHRFARNRTTPKTVPMSPHTFESQTENKTKSKDAYWSTTYIGDNWLFDLKQDTQMKNLMDIIRSQENNESQVVQYHSRFQGKSNSFESANAMNVSANDMTNKKALTPKSPSNKIDTEANTSKEPPFMDRINIYSANKPPPPPNADDASTFVNGRRLLSTLGLLKYHLPLQTRDRDLEILDVEWNNNNSNNNNNSSGNADNSGTTTNDTDASLSKSKVITSNGGNGGDNVSNNDNSNSSTGRYDLRSMLDSLDKISMLDQLDVAIVVHDTNNDKNLPSEELQFSDIDMLRASDLKSHSSEFKYFMNKLCNHVDLDGHTGYTGGITKHDCKRIFYYANSTHEIVFHVPSAMTKVDLNRKKDMYLSAPIRIIWSKSKAPIFLSTQFKPSQRFKRPDTPVIYIRLTPLESGLYRVSIQGDMVLEYLQGKRKFTSDNADVKCKKDINEREREKKCMYMTSELTGRLAGPEIPTTGMSKLIIGPLLDSMVVSESILPHLLRETVVNAAHLISEETNECPIYESLLMRQQMILQMSTDFCRFSPNENAEYFKHFFVEPKQTKKHKQERVSRSKLGQLKSTITTTEDMD
ncbi:AAA+ ATPase, core domain-containing protein [Reticulomyxa filosa]|uniref:AAA+ ATPase, core domain-containing protein n=1 Tax=Reticulomyxa filosa TaxID=46433 RepID=X6NXB5_RETFI|nr:AAA+ ATPase, core domain-containing protein [Reticulomyxa filosa]|eukprot:ETO29902.1 AAA+ ATPase, core domain-containing protein [Reticulomyxa filosa]